MPKAAIVGGGLIGRAWAMVFAASGWDVAIYEQVPEAREKIPGLLGEGLAELQRHGLARDAAAAAQRITVAPELRTATADAEIVQENLPEDLETKRRMFADLDRLAPPSAILASSTSTIVASRFTEDLAGRARCLVAHPVNPPHLVPIVELVGSPWTSPDTIERARAIYDGIGQVPIVVRKEVDGFILNRLQAVLLGEAFRLVGEGYVSPQDLDKTIQHGLGLRWAFMGPFQTIELNAPGGIPDYCTRYGANLGRLMSEPASPSVFSGETVRTIIDEWGKTPSSEGIAERMRWRDARLAALRAHKRAQPPLEQA